MWEIQEFSLRGPPKRHHFAECDFYLGSLGSHQRNKPPKVQNSHDNSEQVPKKRTMIIHVEKKDDKHYHFLS